MIFVSEKEIILINNLQGNKIKASEWLQWDVGQDRNTRKEGDYDGKRTKLDKKRT